MPLVSLAPAPAGSPRHLTGPHHPERPERVDWILAQLRESGLYDSLNVIEFAPAAPGQIEAVHDAAYVRHVEQACRTGETLLDAMDTEVCEGSYEAALVAAGAALALCDAVATGTCASGFAPVRPPGHHAERDRAMGFCLFNNVAVAARHLQSRHGLRRVLIVDWDVHHGNGTQHIFEDDPEVFYFSVHQYPHYPGTGSANETGRGPGRGATLNVPVLPGADDAAYRRIFEETLVPAAREFRPEMILVSAGFDAYRDDPLSEIRLTSAAYGDLTRIVRTIADESGARGIVSLLEGGYHPTGLPASVEAHVRALMAG